ncbi:MAG: hypothetical protein HY690_01555 [Chloroflexi bacterium]|nr:hypothetical protein [Chloroflexota bacterium]
MDDEVAGPVAAAGPHSSPASPRPPLILSWSKGPASIATVWVLLALFVPFVFPTSNPIQGDIWWSLKSGEVMVERGGLLAEDPFTFSPHTPGFVNAQWLAQLIYYLPSRFLGLEGVAFVNALVVAATFGLVLALAWRRCHNLRLAAVCTMLATGVAATNLNPRAQTLGFLLFMLSSWLLTRGQRPGWSLLALAGIEAAWTNIHGSFFLGPALTLLLLAGGALEVAVTRGLRAAVTTPRLRFLGLALGGQALATLATPYGLATYDYVRRIGTDPIIRNLITEWWPTTVQDITGLAFFGSVAVTLAALGWSRRRLSATDVLLLVAFATLGLQTVRNVVWWALATTPILAEHLVQAPLPAWLRRLAARQGAAPRRPAANVLVAGLIVLAMASALPWVKDRNPLLPSDKLGMVAPGEPQGAAAFLLAQQLPARMLNHQGWGGYLDWRLWPRYQTMVDGRIEIHPPSVWQDYLYISFGHATWQERLDHYGIDLLVLSKEHQGELVTLAGASPRWRLVYDDQQAAVFVRTER